MYIHEIIIFINLQYGCKTRISDCLSITHFLRQTPKCGVGNTAMRKDVHRNIQWFDVEHGIYFMRHDFSYFHKNGALRLLKIFLKILSHK